MRGVSLIMLVAVALALTCTGRFVYGFWNGWVLEGWHWAPKLLVVIVVAPIAFVISSRVVAGLLALLLRLPKFLFRDRR